MSTARIEVDKFEAASKKAQRWPVLIELAQMLARDQGDNPLPDTADLVAIGLGKLLNETAEFGGLIQTASHEINQAERVDELVEVGEIRADNGHSASRLLALAFLDAIRIGVDLPGFLKQCSGDKSEFDPASVVADWPAAAAAIVKFPRIDSQPLCAIISRERARVIERLNGQPESQTKKTSAIPMTDSVQVAFDYIKQNGPKSAKEIVNALDLASESAFTSSYVPELKANGVKNRRGAGYYLPDSN